MTVTYFISGASRGIGLSLAKQLSKRADTVVIGSVRDPAAATELTSLASTNSNVHVVTLDVTSKKSALAAADQVRRITDGVDVLIVNAGFSDSYASFADVSEETLEQHWRINVLGAVFTYQAFYPLLQARPTKKIVFTSSVAGSIGSILPVSVSAYGHSKAALNYTARAISVELKDQGFTVIAYNPGPVLSDMGKYGKEKIVGLAPQLKEFFDSSLTPDEAAAAQINVIDNLTAEDNGKFKDTKEGEVAW
ncbi:hypothetical protein V1514DRAFT_323320 [Lipomyces japonicus]|uniref:uncharacterized protein n=1 Tax=Lipomyces japonicus TaxID=56871 RepID=UPI0034CDE15C